MDRMAKLVSGRLKAQAPTGLHPDADALTAFAENALPEAERGQLMQHLASCSDCREILYVASPDAPAMQKVVMPQPRPFMFRRWALGWGALVASVAIAAIFLTTNRLGERNRSVSLISTPPTAANEGRGQIATEKSRPELDRVQAARESKEGDLVVSRTAGPAGRDQTRPRPEPKHMTAKPQANLRFDESGQVRVLGAPTAEVANPNSSNSGLSDKAFGANSPQNLAVQGRNTTPITETASGAQLASSGQVRGGPAADNNAIGYAYSPPTVLKKSGAGSNLGGMVVDPSGAVIADAKVTASGPAGENVVTSGQDGKFSFDTLSSGSYSVKAEANGFKATEMKQVVVAYNMPATIQVRLEPSTASETVEVSAEARVTELQAGEASNGLVQRQPASREASTAPAGGSRRKAVGGAVGAGIGLPALRWTISADGLVERSGDGGKSWQMVTVGTGANFRALSAVGPNIWAGGKGGTLYHSSDSGQSWVKVEPIQGEKKLIQDIEGVDFLDALNGTVRAVSGEVWTTSNGGGTWWIGMAR